MILADGITPLAYGNGDIVTTNNDVDFVGDKPLLIGRAEAETGGVPDPTSQKAAKGPNVLTCCLSLQRDEATSASFSTSISTSTSSPSQPRARTDWEQRRQQRVENAGYVVCRMLFGEDDDRQELCGDGLEDHGE